MSYYLAKVSFGLFLITGIASVASAQSNDFFSNTQRAGLLSSSPSGCPTGATCGTNFPGFNPTDLVNHSDPNATISGTATIAGAVRPFFSQLGPGAITNNLFGVISRVNPGPDTLFNTSDDNPTLCGIPSSPFITGVVPTAVGTNNSSLDCGNLRFDPDSQGMVLPTAGGSFSGTDAIVSFNADFTPSTDSHMGFDFSTGKQVTALTAGGTTATVGTPGTFSVPGSGDQVLNFTISGPLTTQTIDDIDPLTPTTAPFPSNFTDSINTMGLLTTDFSGIGSSIPQSTMPFPCWWSGCTLTAESLTVP
ncbi:MAG: hypothetical protein WAO55_00355 [Candidatus Manganitrophaceae bacterium]